MHTVPKQMQYPLSSLVHGVYRGYIYISLYISHCALSMGKDCMQFLSALQQDEIDSNGRSGAVMVNPMSKKLVMTSAMAYKHLLTDSMYCAAHYAMH